MSFIITIYSFIALYIIFYDSYSNYFSYIIYIKFKLYIEIDREIGNKNKLFYNLNSISTAYLLLLPTGIIIKLIKILEKIEGK